MRRFIHAIEVGGAATALVGVIDSQAVLSWGGALVTLLVMIWASVRRERAADADQRASEADRAIRTAFESRAQARYDRLADHVLKAKLAALAAGKDDPCPGWLDMLEPPSSTPLKEHAD